MANPIFMAGGETGDTAEAVTVTGTVAVDTTAGNHSPQGTYSYKCGSGGGLNSGIKTATGLAAGTIYCRCWFQSNWSVSVGDGETEVIEALGTTNLVIACVGIKVTSGGMVLQAFVSGNSSGGSGSGGTFAQVGSNVSINASQLYSLQMKVVCSTTVGEVHILLNGTEVCTGTGLNTGVTSVDNVLFGQDNGFLNGGATLSSAFVWVDDCIVRTDQYPGNGYNIARQPTGNGNYTGWTPSTGTLASCWNTTPFNATTFISTTTASAAETGPANFTLTGGTGSTGFGTGLVDPFATINGMKIACYGKTSATTSDSADFFRFRTPAGASGADTNGAAFAAWTTSDTFRQTIFTTPTTSQVRSCEYGIVKGATGTRTHTIEDAWIMVDFVPGGLSWDDLPDPNTDTDPTPDDGDNPAYHAFLNDEGWLLSLTPPAPPIAPSLVFQDYTPDPWVDDDPGDIPPYDPLPDNPDWFFNQIYPLNLDDYSEGEGEPEPDQTEDPPEVWLFAQFYPLSLDDYAEGDELPEEPQQTVDPPEDWVFAQFYPLSFDTYAEGEGEDDGSLPPYDPLPDDPTPWLFRQIFPFNLDDYADADGEDEPFQFDDPVDWLLAPHPIVLAFDDYSEGEAEDGEPFLVDDDFSWFIIGLTPAPPPVVIDTLIHWRKINPGGSSDLGLRKIIPSDGL